MQHEPSHPAAGLLDEGTSIRAVDRHGVMMVVASRSGEHERPEYGAANGRDVLDGLGPASTKTGHGVLGEGEFG